MAFCINCGQELVDGANFCSNCGTAIGEYSRKKREQEYAGKINTCPSCGEDIPSFVANCPSCGHEFRGAGPSASVSEFATKLEAASTDAVKANLIRTFPIPNTKEDIWEFMILAISNLENSFQQEVSEAWVSKFEQAYEKAKMLDGETQELSRYYTLFLQKKSLNQKNTHRKVKEQKKRVPLKDRPVLVVFLCFFTVLAVAFFITLPHTIKEQKLEKLVVEVEELINCGDLEAARRKANQIIDDSGWSSESEYKWDDIRESLLESIDRQEILAGTKIHAGISDDELKGKNYEDVISFFEQKGFKNIRTEIIADLKLGWFTKDGEVENVTIDGTSFFSETSAFEPTSEIVIFYHTHKKK